MVLGIGGVTALDEMGIAPSVFHMNEATRLSAIDRVSPHARRLTFRRRPSGGQTTVFTTHTPCRLASTVFRDLVEILPELPAQTGLSFVSSLLTERTRKHDRIQYGALAMNFSSYINGVSKLHAEVSRRMWQASWPKVPIEEIPLASITNGVHTRSWISAEMSELYDRYLGIGWLEEAANHSFWSNVDDIIDSELWRTHEIRREKMISFVRQRLKEQYQRRGAPNDVKLVRKYQFGLSDDRSRGLHPLARNSDLPRRGRLKRILNHRGATDSPAKPP
jgi:starch phosphorylase